MLRVTCKQTDSLNLPVPSLSPAKLKLTSLSPPHGLTVFRNL